MKLKNYILVLFIIVILNTITVRNSCDYLKNIMRFLIGEEESVGAGTKKLPIISHKIMKFDLSGMTRRRGILTSGLIHPSLF